MANDIITNLHPDNDPNTNLYPNIKKENIPNKSINTNKLDDDVLSLIGSLKPSGTDTSTNILAFTSDKGIYVATDNGHWYYWNGVNYTNGGVYQSSEDIKQIEEDLSLIATIEENLFNKDSEDIITNKYVRGDGTFENNDYYFVSNYIEVSNGDVVNANLSNDYYGGCLYDRNKTALGRIQFVNKSYTINNTNAAYIRLNGFIANIDNAMVSINRPLPESYIPFGTSVIPADDFQMTFNPLYRKKAIFNGDSICYGAGFPGGYASMIGNNNNMTIVNYAVSGATITAETQTTTYWICRNISSMSDDADYIILEGGVNDPNSDNMGIITSGFNEPLDDTTFCGAFESMLKQAILKWKGKKIGFILTPKAYSYDGSGADKNKWDNVRAICEKWSVPYLDLRNMSGLTAGLSEINQMFFKDGDGVHPNEAGYKVIVPKIEAWMKAL